MSDTPRSPGSNPTVELVPMSASNFEYWNGRIWEMYRDELIRSGVSEAAARQDVERNIAEFSPDGKMAAGHYVFDVVAGDEEIGYVWLKDSDSSWFIYDIEIHDQMRGRGYGRATMRAIEDFVRARSGSKISLSVFGFNEVAQKLYLSEGYEITRLAMSKPLIP